MYLPLIQFDFFFIDRVSKKCLKDKNDDNVSVNLC